MNPLSRRLSPSTKSIAVALATLTACAGKETKPDEKVVQPVAAAVETAAAPAFDGPPTGVVGQVTIGEKQIAVTPANARELLGTLLEKPHSTLGELGLVFFSLDSDALGEESKRWLGDVATALKASPALRLRLGGHADERGSDAYNDALSLRAGASSPVEAERNAARRLPKIHRIFSLLKRVLLATYHCGVSQKHLNAYVDEFVFRFNRRASASRFLLFERLIGAGFRRVPTARQIVDRDPQHLGAT